MSFAYPLSFEPAAPRPVGEPSRADMFVHGRRATGSGPDAISAISGFDPNWASNYIDLPAVHDELASLIESAGNMEPLQRAEASPENRRQYVLAWLNANPEVARDVTTEHYRDSLRRPYPNAGCRRRRSPSCGMPVGPSGKRVFS